MTTGISAADRARTIAVATDASNGSDHIVTPGHVFPLVAKPGGVLVRAGHAEAAVDVWRLAGLSPSGVICEIMNDDGTLARLDDLVAFAQRHGLKIGTIRDLIAYRRRYDHKVGKIVETSFESRYGGEWRAITDRNKAVGTETLALVKGRINPDEPTLVRMHTYTIFSDTLGEFSNRSRMLQGAMKAIGEAGAGVVVVINRSVPNMMSRVISARASGKPLEGDEMSELRDYGIGAQLLAKLGIHDIVLLTNTHHTLVALAGYDLNTSPASCRLDAVRIRVSTGSRRISFSCRRDRATRGSRTP